MTRLLVTETAAADLEYLINTHSLPDSTRSRLNAVIRPLTSFPRMGVRLQGRLGESRFLVGPWPWMITLYRYDEASDTVLILAIEDGRTSTASTFER